MTIGKEFLSSAITRFKDYKTLGDKTFAQLQDEDFFLQPNTASNSIAVTIQHLHGNMVSRWTNFLTEDGEKEWRRRDAEFEPLTHSKQEILSLWNEGWHCLLQTLESLTPTDLHKTATIRTEPLQVYDAILRQLAHYPYHVGQIVYLGRLLKNETWRSLSIPKGNSAAYLESVKQEQKK